MKNIIFLFALSCSISCLSQTFTLRSNEIGGQATNKQLFDGFGCTGENKSPQLYWENAPKDTKSFAVTIYDEDAPTGSGWWHWIVFNMPANTKELISGAGDCTKNLTPMGSIQSLTDFGKNGYGGPCPPAGDGYHKYTITVYALKTEKLDLDKNSNPALVGFYLTNNLIEKASIVMYYRR